MKMIIKFNRRKGYKDKMKKITVIYWSGTGNTETMAKAVAEGASSNETEVKVLSAENASYTDVEEADAVALGCPSMGDEVLEEEVMEPFIESLKDKVKDKPMVLFGSYGWGNGEWMEDWANRMEEYGAKLVADNVIVNDAPDDNGLSLCHQLGQALCD